MTGNDSPAAILQLVGGELCLDFANTVGNHKTDQPSEHLANYADLVVWSQHAGILAKRDTEQLLAEATRRPNAASQVYRSAIALREDLYRIFLAIAQDKSPLAADLNALNETLADALAHSRIVSTKEGFTWAWSDELAPDRMLWFIARSAADLLTSGNLNRVSQCGDDECGWLFIDTSKNHSRRWCAMNDCGNRAKARRHYTRLRAASKSRKENR
jgi:predicted RNA-binding Zn ribbon-like protein